MPAKNIDELIALCKRRGFIFQSSEIYGGTQGLYDYGPLGVELKNNIKNSWWKSIVYERDDVEGLDASILTKPVVLKHSGHEETFTDPLIDCKKCNGRWRADHLESSSCSLTKKSVVDCNKKDLTDARPFNLMFKTNMGPIDDGSSFATYDQKQHNKFLLILKMWLIQHHEWCLLELPKWGKLLEMK